jgi:hypothetical protein
MYAFLLVIMMFGVVIGITPIKTQETVFAEHSAKVMARNVMEYRLACARYLEANPTASGSVNDTDLLLPPYYRKMADYIFYIDNGMGWVVVPVIAPDIEFHLSEIIGQGLETPVMGTVTAANQIRSTFHGVVPVAVTPGIPVGAFVTLVRID